MHKKLCETFLFAKVKKYKYPIENILLKHNTGAILCFSKNTFVVQNLLRKGLLSDKKQRYFAEQAKINYDLAVVVVVV